MGLVLWIDQNTFATSLFERVFKKKGLPFYTLTSVDDFSYLVDDLHPALIVLDYETYIKNPDALKRQYSESAKMKSIPFILIEPKEQLEFLENKIGEIKRPIEAFELPEMLNKFLSSH